jgi:hypothetical protein
MPHFQIASAILVEQGSNNGINPPGVMNHNNLVSVFFAASPHPKQNDISFLKW